MLNLVLTIVSTHVRVVTSDFNPLKMLCTVQRVTITALQKSFSMSRSELPGRYDWQAIDLRASREPSEVTCQPRSH